MVTPAYEGYRQGFVEACLDRAPAQARDWIVGLDAVVAESVACRAREVDRTGAYPEAGLSALADAGVFAVAAPESSGGLGLGDAVALLALEMIASSCASTAAIVMFHTQVVQRIVRHGSRRQQVHDLPRLATGSWRGASAWTERGAGPDKRSMSSRLYHEGPDWTVTAVKSFTTGLEGADVVHVLVGCTGPDGQMEPTFVRVETSVPGVDVLEIYDLVGLRGSSTGTLRLHQVPVSHEDLLGELGSGRRLMADNHTTGLNPGVLALGIGRAAFDAALRFVSDGGANGSRAAESEAARFALTDLEVELGAAYAYAAEAIRSASEGTAAARLAFSRFKLLATERLADTVARAARLCGSAAMTDGLPLERHLRDAQAVVAMGPANRMIRELVAQQILSSAELRSAT